MKFKIFDIYISPQTELHLWRTAPRSIEWVLCHQAGTTWTHLAPRKTMMTSSIAKRDGLTSCRGSQKIADYGALWVNTNCLLKFTIYHTTLIFSSKEELMSTKRASKPLMISLWDWKPWRGIYPNSSLYLYYLIPYPIPTYAPVWPRHQGPQIMSCKLTCGHSQMDLLTMNTPGLSTTFLKWLEPTLSLR